MMNSRERRDDMYDTGSANWRSVDDVATLWRELELTFGTRNAPEIIHRLRLLRAAICVVPVVSVS
jgi:hypothetical protein